IDRQAEQQRGEFRQHLYAAADVEAALLGKFELERKAHDRIDDQRETDNKPERHPEHRRLLPGLFLSLLRPITERDSADDAQRDGDEHDAEPRLLDRLRDEETAIVEVHAAQK